MAEGEGNSTDKGQPLPPHKVLKYWRSRNTKMTLSIMPYAKHQPRWVIGSKIQTQNTKLLEKSIMANHSDLGHGRILRYDVRNVIYKMKCDKQDAIKISSC